MVLTQKKTHKSIKQKREPRKKLTVTWSINLQEGCKNIQWGKDNLFNKRCWKNWTDTCNRIKMDYSPMPGTKINYKWIKDLKVRPETKKLVE